MTSTAPSSFTQLVQLNLNSAAKVISQADGDMHFSALTHYPNQNAFAGKSIAILTHNISLLLETLAACDGYAKSIAIIGPNFSDDDISVLLEKVIPDVLISDIMVHDQYKTYASSADILMEECNGDKTTYETKWLLSTSGTTGTPKLVKHTLKSLLKTVSSTPSRNTTRVWGLLYNFDRFAGIQVILQAIAHSEPLVVPDLSLPISDQLQFLKKHGCTALSATPSLWRKILMTPEGKNLPLKQVTLGGEIADQRILDALKSAYPNAFITHIFASTEAGACFSVKDGHEGFPKSYLTHSPQEVELKIDQNRLWVKNTQVELYETAQHENGWVDTGDSVTLKNDRVYFLGRESGIINVGGAKVHPETVESILSSHPEVDIVNVYALKNPILGALVCADIETQTTGKEGLDQLKKELLVLAKEALPNYAVPAKIKFTSNLELSPAGKVQRK